MKNNLTTNQREQENEYCFPYHYLDLRVDLYKYLNSITHLTYLNVIKKILISYNPHSILDLGCGDGRLCFELKNEKWRVTGVDYSKPAINFAKIFNPECEFFVRDAKKLNLKNKFDFIILSEVLEHFPPQEINLIFDKIKEHLTPEGKILISVPSTNAPLPKKHYQHFSPESLTKTVLSHFEVQEILGYQKNNYQRTIFINLKRIGIFFYLFKNLNIIKRYYQFIDEYYKKNVALGDPKKCLTLITVCRLKDKILP